MWAIKQFCDPQKLFFIAICGLRSIYSLECGLPIYLSLRSWPYRVSSIIQMTELDDIEEVKILCLEIFVFSTFEYKNVCKREV